MYSIYTEITRYSVPYAVFPMLCPIQNIGYLHCSSVISVVPAIAIPY